MKVPHQRLHTLGGNLGLEEDQIQDSLAQYPPEERHQRLMEQWFRNESDPTWEKLGKALPSSVLPNKPTTLPYQLESPTSADGVSEALTSPNSKE